MIVCMLSRLFSGLTHWSFHEIFVVDKVVTAIVLSQSTSVSPDLLSAHQCSILMCKFTQLDSEGQAGEAWKYSNKPKVSRYRGV